MPEKQDNGLRIAMLGHKRVPSREGGIEIVVGELATRMVSQGHSVTCYNRQGHHVSGADFDGKNIDNYKGVRLKSVWTIPKYGLAAASSSFFAALSAAFGRYDIVHFHAEGPCAMLWIPKLFGKKCIATIHGLDHQRAKWGKFASFYIRLGEKCAARLADEIIVLSDSAQEYFLEKYNRETVYIPNGVGRPTEKEADEITERFGLKKDEYILFLGRLVPEKGLNCLIKAFKQVNTDKKLVIAGGSSDAPMFEEKIRALAANDARVLFTGFVEGDVLAELYSNAYTYVLPSDLEGMPISLLEAMSYGNCCLTSDIPECANVMGEFGLTFRKGDVSDLADKLQQLCDDPAAVNYYRKQSADYICNKYNWEDVILQTLRLYGVDVSTFSIPDAQQQQDNLTV